MFTLYKIKTTFVRNFIHKSEQSMCVVYYSITAANN